MSPHVTSDPWTCTTCRIEIEHRPTFHVGLAFCCAGCVADGPCTCSYDEPIIGADMGTDVSRDTLSLMGLPILTR